MGSLRSLRRESKQQPYNKPEYGEFRITIDSKTYIIPYFKNTSFQSIVDKINEHPEMVASLVNGTVFISKK